MALSKSEIARLIQNDIDSDGHLVNSDPILRGFLNTSASSKTVRDKSFTYAKCKCNLYRDHHASKTFIILRNMVRKCGKKCANRKQEPLGSKPVNLYGKTAANYWGILLAISSLRRQYKKSEIAALAGENGILKIMKYLTAVISDHYNKIGRTSEIDLNSFCPIFFVEIESEFATLCGRDVSSLLVANGLEHDMTFKYICDILADGKPRKNATL